MKPIFLCALLGGVLGSSLAYTQTQPGTDTSAQVPVPPAGNKQPKFFAKMEEQFQNADVDKDGSLNRTEAENGGLKRIVDNFDRIDANKDGKVTREEIRALIRNRISS
jgi:hypothetical protein